MTLISRSYSIRDFKSSKDKDFVRAIGIYSKFVKPSIKTNTNEIAYWLDNYERQFRAKYGDRFFVLGFYFEDDLIGYAQFVYIKESRLIIFDYLVLDAQYREYNAFFDFIFFVRQYIEEKELIFDYVVAEVGYTGANSEL